METGAIMRRWNQPRWLQSAALIHSVYATDTYHRQLIPLAERAQVAEVVGAEAERLAFLFAAVSRDALFDLIDGVGVIPRQEVELPCRHGIEQRTQTLAPAGLGHLLLLHMVNHAEQVRDATGAPTLWLSKVSGWARKLDPEMVSVPKLFASRDDQLRARDEREGLERYIAALNHLDDPDAAKRELQEAAEKNPWIGEPCAWLSLMSLRLGDRAASTAWNVEARRRFRRLGVAWDPRMSFNRWLLTLTALERLAQKLTPAPKNGHREPHTSSTSTSEEASAQPITARLQRYLASLAGGAADAAARIYPDLRKQAWHDPSAFPAAMALADSFDAIREEIASCDPSAYHREIENIPRTGSWDVLMFYERGRRNDALCEACPVTAAILASRETIRTHAGLAYVSRLRPGTHIAPHRGPTNMRVRCHLGLEIPEGDCGLRVGSDTRTWVEGSCIVFDDYLVHEAWNAADTDRIVLVVDLWHPDLLDDEIRYIDGLQRYAMSHAINLHTYWDANRRARGELYH